MKKRSDRIGIRSSGWDDPGGYKVGDTVGMRGLNQVLLPDELIKGAIGCRKSAGEPVEDDGFLRGQFHEQPLADLDKHDDRDPLPGTGYTLTGYEIEIDGPGCHNETYEECGPEGFHTEPIRIGRALG